MNKQQAFIKRNQRQNSTLKLMWLLNKLLFNLVSWTFWTAIFFYLIFLLYPEIGYKGSKFFQLAKENHYVPLLLAGCIAFFSWLVEDVVFYRFLSRKSIGVVFLFRLIGLVILLIFVFLLVSAYHYHNKIFTDIAEYLTLLKWFFLSRTTLALFIIATIISSIINMAKAVRQKVGTNSFLKIVSGYYRTPREEDRIFIFIDLISSTRYAEQLGHRRYSTFLQNCFKPLGLLEIKYRAMQYQIIGDEVVLTWTTKNPRNFRNAVKFYYEFIDILQSRHEQFEKEFGLIPNFTASINSGKIMVSEVGSVKSEIAFHGDVLNTAARIQKQCKSYNKRLLVTKKFADSFRHVSDGFTIDWVTTDYLVGKERAVDIYAIERQPDYKIGNDYDYTISIKCS